MILTPKAVHIFPRAAWARRLFVAIAVGGESGIILNCWFCDEARVPLATVMVSLYACGGSKSDCGKLVCSY